MFMYEWLFTSRKQSSDADKNKFREIVDNKSDFQ